MTKLSKRLGFRHLMQFYTHNRSNKIEKTPNQTNEKFTMRTREKFIKNFIKNSFLIKPTECFLAYWNNKLAIELYA